MSITYREALALSAVDLPAHLVADAEVPILAGAQAQGDVLVVPWADAPDDVAEALRTANRRDGFRPERDPLAVPDEGVRVVGVAWGNAHVLHRGFDSPDVQFAALTGRGRFTTALGIEDLTVGVILVPEGQTAVLVHTDEHGANGLASGVYLVKRKRELRASRGAALVDD